jgi:DNA-binding transcriptional LysR family regulator
MDNRHLRVFLAVAKELHFGKAAASLHITQSAVSRTIQDLEQHLAVALFKRSKHEVRLSAAGSELQSHAQHILREVGLAERACRRAAQGTSGVLRLGFIGSIATGFLPMVLKAFGKMYPDVEVSLQEASSSVQLEWLTQSRLDCGIVGLLPKSGAPTPKGVSFHPILEEPLVAALPTDHRLAEQKQVSLKHLAQALPLILTSTRDNAPEFNPWLLSLYKKASAEPQLLREAGRAASVLCAIGAGQGHSLFPAQISYWQVPGVRFSAISTRLPNYRYALVHLEGQPGPIVQRFHQTLLETMV